MWPGKRIMLCLLAAKMLSGFWTSDCRWQRTASGAVHLVFETLSLIGLEFNKLAILGYPGPHACAGTILSELTSKASDLFLV